MNTPVFDPKKDHGTIYGSGAEGGTLARYSQGGHHFMADGTYLEPDGQKPARVLPTLVANAPKVEVNTLPAVGPDEAETLLTTDPRAEDLMALPRDRLAELVGALNGPMIVGVDSQKAMVAFILKNTRPAGTVKPVPVAAPAETTTLPSSDEL